MTSTQFLKSPTLYAIGPSVAARLSWAGKKIEQGGGPAPWGAEPVLRMGRFLSQPFSLQIDPKPSPVVGLITEALGLCRKVHCNLGGDTTLVDMDGYPFLEGLTDVEGQFDPSWGKHLEAIALVGLEGF